MGRIAATTVADLQPGGWQGTGRRLSGENGRIRECITKRERAMQCNAETAVGLARNTYPQQLLVHYTAEQVTCRLYSNLLFRVMHHQAKQVGH